MNGNDKIINHSHDGVIFLKLRTNLPMQYRVSHMKVSGAVGECSCGVTVNLQDEDSGVIITTDMLCNRLGIVFDRYKTIRHS